MGKIQGFPHKNRCCPESTARAGPLDTFPRTLMCLTRARHQSAKHRAHFRSAGERYLHTMAQTERQPAQNPKNAQRLGDARARQSFGGMTLAQSVRRPSRLRPRATHRRPRRPTQTGQADRDRADEDSLAKAQLVINGVIGDPTEGPDSALYEAMGYSRKSERKSGLTRKRNTTNNPNHVTHKRRRVRPSAIQTNAPPSLLTARHPQ